MPHLQPFTGPAAWRGPDLASQPAWIHHLTEAETAELDRTIHAVKAAGTPLGEIATTDHPLPTLSPEIARWRRALADGAGFVLVRGFPVHRYAKEDAALAYWIIGRHLGTAVPQNAQGDLLGHVRDHGDDPSKAGTRLYRTRARQDFHTDGADIIGLFCLQRSKSGGVSRIVSSVSVFNEILRRRPDLAPLLFEDFYWDMAADARPGGPRTVRFPICRIENGRLATMYIGWYIRNAQRFPEVPRLTPDQVRLLDLIEEIANDPAFHLDMDFEPGDMQFLKNAAILRARTEYEDWEDPALKRHLLRLWLAAPDFVDGHATLRSGIEAGGVR